MPQPPPCIIRIRNEVMFLRIMLGLARIVATAFSHHYLLINAIIYICRQTTSRSRLTMCRLRILNERSHCSMVVPFEAELVGAGNDFGFVSWNIMKRSKMTRFCTRTYCMWNCGPRYPKDTIRFEFDAWQPTISSRP